MAIEVDALIAPKAFKSKDKDPETLLIDFDLYIKTIKNFFIATGRDVVNSSNHVAAVAADTFEQAIEKIRNGIVGKTNQVMSRLRLFQQMGQGSQKFGAWQKEIYKQAKRCDWSNYGIEDAVRDAMLYQTSDQKLRKRILANNLSYEDTVSYGASPMRKPAGRPSWWKRQQTGLRTR